MFPLDVLLVFLCFVTERLHLQEYEENQEALGLQRGLPANQGRYASSRLLYSRPLMTDPQQIEILDLRHFNASQMRPLLEQEARLWLRTLRWDYRSSIDLLLQYLDSRILLGFVALVGGRICGYTFFVYEGTKAVVGDLYVSNEKPATVVIARHLVQHLLSVLEASPDVDRIEAQLLLYEAAVLPPLFPGFRSYRRLFLERRLTPDARRSKHAPTAVTSSDVELCSWTPGFYQPSGELIHAAYHDHIDSDINDQYRTLDGCLRFLHNVVRFPGCGVFDPEASWVFRDRSTRILAAILLCSRITPEGVDGPVAHITQLCVAPNYRRRSLGRTLLQICLGQLPARGYRSLTLTVTEANHIALNLYLSTEFEVRRPFDALVREKTVRR